MKNRFVCDQNSKKNYKALIKTDELVRGTTYRTIEGNYDKINDHQGHGQQNEY